jgi:hypothetical protein
MKSPLIPSLAAAGLALVLGNRARAMNADIGTVAGSCQFPTAVRLGLCSGVYVGSGVVLTAAHCIGDISEGQSRVRFGEDTSDAAFDPVVDHCVKHPDGANGATIFGEDDYDGVDLAYCILDDADPIPDDLPIVPPMIPTGCERDWLAHQVYETGSHPIVTAVGSGCSEYVGPAEDCGDGIKRWVALQLTEQTSYGGSSTKLEVVRFDEDSTGLMSGDSGGPLFEVLPDGSWRVLGVLHGTNAAYHAGFYEAVPPYLHWIEQDSGRDITPCHEFADGEWTFHGACAGELPLDTNESGASWANECPSDLGGGEEGFLQCYDLPPGDKAIPARDEPRLPSEVFLPAAGLLLREPATLRGGAATALVSKLTPLAVFPFLARDLPGTLPIDWLEKPAKMRKARRDHRKGR